MSKLYKRFCRLVVAEDSRNEMAVDFSQFRVVFSITNMVSGAPPTADIRIYNVSDDTVSRIRQEGQKVILEAGYEESRGVIFQGDLVQRYKGTVGDKEDFRLDSILQIVARTNDKAQTSAMINTSLPAGADASRLAKRSLDEYGKYDIKPGKIPDLSGAKLTRGKVYYGPLKSVLDNFCRTHELQSCYYGDELSVIPVKETFGEAPVVLNRKAGHEHFRTESQNAYEAGNQTEYHLADRQQRYCLRQFEQYDGKREFGYGTESGVCRKNRGH